MLLEVQHVQKQYQTRGTTTRALADVHFAVNAGEFVAIMGESGSGKSTLLNIIATYDRPTQGKVLLNGTDFSSLKAKDIASFRRQKLGFVFQDFNLLDTFNNRDNILLPLVLSNTPVKEMEQRLEQVSAFVGIHSFLNKYPYELSGGQRQRIAIARALITRPEIILADEPTGSLDSKTSQQILKVLSDINGQGNTILMVTHSIKAAAVASRILFIKDGVIFHELYRGQLSYVDFQEKIADTLSLLNKEEVLC